MGEDKNFFHCPAYKLMISDIRCAVQKPSQPHDLGVEEEVEDGWYLTIDKVAKQTGQSTKPGIFLNRPLELHLKLIWIQGTVVRIEESDAENLSLVIRDEDSEKEEAVIFEYNTVPGGDHPDIKIGSYVGALGQIYSNYPVVVLKATKVMHLSDKEKPLHRTMWKDEVTLCKAFLAGLILPTSS